MTRFQKNLFNLGMFQAGWVICVLGGNLGALLFTPLALALHQWLLLENRAEWKLIALVTLVGSGWDIAMAAVGAVDYAGGVIFGIPPWLVCLWLMFATTFMHGLRWLHPHRWLAAVAAALLGPASYWAGSRISDAEIGAPLLLSLGLMAIGWALLFPFGMRYASRLTT